jgi:hypothetical protein
MGPRTLGLRRLHHDGWTASVVAMISLAAALSGGCGSSGTADGDSPPAGGVGPSASASPKEKSAGDKTAGTPSIGQQSSPAGKTSVRTWTDSTGQRKVEATFLGVENDVARFKKTTGVEVAIPLDRLCKADQEFIKAQAAADAFGQPATPAQMPPAADALVLVTAALGGKSTVVPGFVFHRDKDRAYVVMENVMGHLTSRQDSWSIPRKEVEITVAWGPEGQAHKVRGELLAEYRKLRRWIVAGPAKELPPPAAVDPKTAIAEPMKIKIAGYQCSYTRDGRSFARAMEDGVLKEIRRNVRLGADTYLIDVAGPANFSHALVTTESGAAIATIIQNPAAYAPRDLRDPRDPRDPRVRNVIVAATPLEEMASLLDPQVDHVAFAPRKGDAKVVEYEFVAYVEDPFGRLDSPRLLIRPHRGQSTSMHWEPGSDVQWKRMGDDVVELAMTQESPSEEARPRLAAHEFHAQAVTWVSRHEAANPGAVQDIQFDIQFSYKGRDGGVRYLPPGTHSFSVASPHFGRPFPQIDIPGLDGYPTGMPKATKHKNGGYQITSEATRITHTPPGGLPDPVPQPKQGEKSLAGKTRRSDPWEIVTLDLGSPLAEEHDRERAPMLFSPDGKWLYLIDGKNVLRKIRAADLTEEKSLDIAGACNEMSFSKEGILLAVRSTSALWVVDPDSLNVLRATRVYGLRLVAGSPATSVGFALGTTSEGRDAGRAPELSMIDLAKGQLLHGLRKEYGGHIFMVGRGTIFDSARLIGDMRMSNDGKYLYTGDDEITRFRLEGQDLVLDGSSRTSHSANTTHFAFSDDDKLLARPSGGRSSVGGYGIAVLDAGDFSQKFEFFNDAYPSAIGFDAKTGDIYSPNLNGMNIFDRRGVKLQHIKWEKQRPHFIHRLIVHPQGKCFVVWEQESIMVFRRQTN